MEQTIKKAKKQVIPAHNNAETLEDSWIRSHATDIPQTENDEKIIKLALLEVQSFSSLNETEIPALCDAMRPFAFKRGECVVQEGMDGSHFFVIASGTFSVHIGGVLKRSMGAGTAFGDLALLYNCPRTATIRAETDGVVWGLPRTIFREVLKALTERNFGENLAFLESVQAFEQLNSQQRANICAALVVQKFSPGQVIMQEGSQGDSLYIVKEGEVDVSISSKGFVRILSKGAYFGERALLYEEPRSATVKAGDKAGATVLRLTREEIERRLGNLQLVLYSNVLLTSLQNSPIFTRLAPEQQQKLVRQAAILEYSPGHIIMDPTTDRCFIVVLDGEVRVDPVAYPNSPIPSELVEAGAPTVSAILKKGGAFGECYVLHKTAAMRHAVTAVGNGPCRLGVFVQESFDLVVGAAAGGLSHVLEVNARINALRSVYIFRHLSESQLLKMVAGFVELTLHEGDTVIRQGDRGDRFFVVKEGFVAVSKDGKHIRTCGRGNYFGERALLFDEPRSATISAISETVTLWAVDTQTFHSAVDGPMRSHLMERIALQDSHVQFGELEVKRVVGRGTFGTVKLVQHKKTGTRYALKCIKRCSVAQLHQQQNILLEREILAENDHPFIVKLVTTFKDSRYLYFLTELITGGELYEAIRKLGLLSRKQAQFYYGAILLALESLHSRGIAYRDLKPENVMLDALGYTKLIDFGCAKKLKGRSATLVGTPHYMAPEVIRSRGYGVSADLWSLGVCLYEFVCGPLPFGNDAEDQLDIFRDILTGPLVFPNYVRDQEAISCIKGLLTRQEGARLGANNGMQELKDHPFMADFSFEALLSRQLPAPLKPEGETYAEDAEVANGTAPPAEEEEDPAIDNVGAAAMGAWDANF